MGITVEAGWNVVLDLQTDREIEVLIDTFKYDFPPDGVLRIIVIQEPFFKLIDPVMRLPDFYHYVFTYHQDILDNNPKARFLVNPGCWVDPFNLHTKKFAISTLVGGKIDKGFPGYILRHDLWKNQNKIHTPREFYLSSNCRYVGADYTNNLVLGDTKEPMFDCMFHIAIENVYVHNLFSEKVMDCFMSRTIPIHFGTPNLMEYFNPRGFFSCSTLSEIIETANRLTPALYQERAGAVEDNWHRAMALYPYTEVLKRKIMEVLSE